MIRLHRLSTHNFKQLSEVSLQFPEQGTVLIEGLNEAGKSSLFEAVFFALYGRPLLSDRDYGINDLKTYGADEMRVELDFSIEGRPFSISRRFGSAHTARLVCPVGEGGTDTITRNRAVSERLKEEMRLSAEALLNTCFVEQKGLERLESLDLAKRRETVNELLNLRALTTMEAAYRITTADSDQTRLCRQRLRIAQMDVCLPGLQSAERAARCCLMYCRLLRCDELIRQLEEQIEEARTRRAAITVRRAEIDAALDAAGRLKARIQAIETDLSLRVRAWAGALSQRDDADRRVQELEALAAWLPGEEARLQAWEALRERLEELERLENEAEQAREALCRAEERLAHRDSIEQAWLAGEEQLGNLAGAHDTATAELAVAEERQKERRRAARRSERLALLLQHLAAWRRAREEIAELDGRLGTARERAGDLSSSRALVEALRDTEARLRRQEQEKSELTRVEEELERSKIALAAALEREGRVRDLEADLRALEGKLNGSRTEEELAGMIRRQAEARVALGHWIEAAERCAEIDPNSGRMGEVEQQYSLAGAWLEEAKRSTHEAGRQLRRSISIAAAVLLAGAGGAAAHQLMTLGAAGFLAALAAMVWAAVLGKKLTDARAAMVKAQRACDTLEGARQAVQAQVAAAAAERDRWQARERECREALSDLELDVPSDAEGGRRAMAALPEITGAAAQERHRTAQAELNKLQTDWEVARRSLEAERAQAASVGPAALREGVAGLEASREERHERWAQYEDLPAALEALGLRSAADLPPAMDAARRQEAGSAAAAETIPGLEQQREQRLETGADQQGQAEQMARELDLPGPDPEAWAAAAEAERETYFQEAEAVPDTVLDGKVVQARDAAATIQQQISLLELEQSRHHTELELYSREALAAAEAECRGAMAANAAARQSFEDVCPALEAAGLPADSPALRTKLAVARNTLDGRRAEAEGLPDAGEALSRLTGEVLQRRDELAAAWEQQLDVPLPGEPDEAAGVLEQQSVLARQELQTLHEPELREEDMGLQSEDEGLRLKAATWTDQSEQAQDRRREGLGQLEELGIEMEGSLTALPERHPELSAAGDHAESEWEAEVLRREDAVRASRSDRRAAAQNLGIGDEPLDLSAEQEALAEVERELAVRRRAGEIVQQTRRSIVERVMPLTMQNMRLILPLLTEERYRDAEWDEQSNVISVFDSRAGAFQRKRVFSGGARDQISLSLRLAFALATLPGEHNVRPGWLFLDEPLSSFDPSRTQALVDLLTRGLVRRQFAQIFLISHSQSFDPSQFDYRIRIDAGQIVESTLPADAPSALF